MKTILLPTLLGLAVIAGTQGDAGPQMQHKSMAAAEVKTQPAEFLPSCTQLASLRGDPAKEAATIFARADSNCVIPWHWHTPIEEVMMISGRARVDMRNGGKETLIAGTYIAFPPKSVHQFTCEKQCTFYVVSGGPFDIHYVDEQGNEIPLEHALKTGKARSTTPK